MKTKTMYEIRSFTGNDFSKSLSAKLRSPERARKLVKKLRKMGIEAFKVLYKIAVKRG